VRGGGGAAVYESAMTKRIQGGKDQKEENQPSWSSSIYGRKESDGHLSNKRLPIAPFSRIHKSYLTRQKAGMCIDKYQQSDRLRQNETRYSRIYKFPRDWDHWRMYAGQARTFFGILVDSWENISYTLDPILYLTSDPRVIRTCHIRSCDGIGRTWAVSRIFTLDQKIPPR